MRPNLRGSGPASAAVFQVGTRVRRAESEPREGRTMRVIHPFVNSLMSSSLGRRGVNAPDRTNVRSSATWVPIFFSLEDEGAETTFKRTI